MLNHACVENPALSQTLGNLQKNEHCVSGGEDDIEGDNACLTGKCGWVNIGYYVCCATSSPKNFDHCPPALQGIGDKCGDHSYCTSGLCDLDSNSGTYQRCIDKTLITNTACDQSVDECITNCGYISNTHKCCRSAADLNNGHCPVHSQEEGDYCGLDGTYCMNNLRCDLTQVLSSPFFGTGLVKRQIIA